MSGILTELIKALSTNDIIFGLGPQGVEKCKYFTIEVGARGGSGPKIVRSLPSLCKGPLSRLSEIVARKSYVLYLAYDSKTWAQSELIVISGPPPSMSSCQQTDPGKRVGRKRAREPLPEM